MNLKSKMTALANSIATAAQSEKGKMLITTAAAVGVALISPHVAAWSVPANGSFAYSIYDTAVNDILKGPIGFAGGVGIIAYSASHFNQGPWKAITGVLVGSGIAKADTITTSMGAMVDGAQHLTHLLQ